MKYETKMRVLNFVSEVEYIKVVGICTYDSLTGHRGPSVDAIQQAVNEGLVEFDPADRILLTEKGKEVLAPTKLRRLTFLVPLEHVIAVNHMVNEYLLEVKRETGA